MMRMQKKKKSDKSLSFRNVVNRARTAIKTNGSGSDLNKSARIALRKDRRIKRKIKNPRIISVPKTGGFLPLIPIFAGLSALGALGGGAAGIAKAVNDAKAATEQLKEAKRHNKMIEAIAMSKGLYLKPYRKGLGLHLKNYQ